MDSAASARNRHNQLRRWRRPDDPVVVEAGRDARAAKLAEYIERVVNEAPPLTEDQKSALSLLLRPPGGDAS